MNKLLSRITKGLLGLSLVCGVGIALASNNKDTARADAGEAVAYTLDGTIIGTGNGYVDDNPITQGNKSWIVNGNTKISPWRLGGSKSHGLNVAGVIRKVQSQSSLSSENISKVVISTTKPSSNGITPTDVTLKVGSSAGGSQTSSLSNGSWASSVTFNRPDGVNWSNKYFEIAFVMPQNNTTTTKFIQFNSATFYYESNIQATSLTLGSITTYPGHTANVSITPNPNGAVLPASLTYTSLDESIFTVSNGVVTGVSAGSATLRVESASDNTVYGTATVTVNSYPAVDSRVTVDGSNQYAIYVNSSKSGESLNYSLTGVSGKNGVSSAGETSVNINTRFSIVSGYYPNTIAIRTSENKYLGYTCEISSTGNNELHLIDNIDFTSSWIVTDTQLIPARTYLTTGMRHLSMNDTNGTAHFNCYITTSNSYVPVSFYEIAAQSLTGISVNDVSLYPAHEKTLSVLPVPSQASLEGATYTFTSATPAVATVDENGVVSALATGSSLITINASVGGNNYSTTATVTVQDYPTASGLTLNSSYIITGELESTEYEFTGLDTEHNCGAVTAVSGSYAKSFVIKPVEGYYTNTIAFESVDGSGYLKSTKSSSNLTLATKLALNTSWVVSYSNSTYSVISAETYGESSQRHLLLNKNSGDPRIGCYSGVSNTIVNISFFSAEVTATDFTLSESEVSIYKTQTHTLTAEFTPSNTTDRTLSWSSNNTSVATVSNGVVTGVAPGTATITAAKVIGGNTVSRTCSVTVLNNIAEHAGTLADPYNVNDAVNVAKGFFTEDSHGNPVVITGAYVKGIVTNLSYKSLSSISFWIGDNASQTNADNGGFEIYSPATIMGKTVSERYTAVSQIEEDFAVGVTIIACGDITVYHSTSEFAAGSNVVLNNHIEAVDFAKGFNDAITDGVCESDGSTNQSELASAWLDQADNFDMLDDSTKELFLLIAENGDENGNDIEHAVATYDYILKKYNTKQVTTYIDFMGRVSNHIVTLPVSSNYLLGSVITNNTDVIVILIATLTSISCLSAFILIKKRRTN